MNRKSCTVYMVEVNGGETLRVIASSWLEAAKEAEKINGLKAIKVWPTCNPEAVYECE